MYGEKLDNIVKLSSIRFWRERDRSGNFPRNNWFDAWLIFNKKFWSREWSRKMIEISCIWDESSNGLRNYRWKSDENFEFSNRNWRNSKNINERIGKLVSIEFRKKQVGVEIRGKSSNGKVIKISNQ